MKAMPLQDNTLTLLLLLLQLFLRVFDTNGYGISGAPVQHGTGTVNSYSAVPEAAVSEGFATKPYGALSGSVGYSSSASGDYFDPEASVSAALTEADQTYASGYTEANSDNYGN